MSATYRRKLIEVAIPLMDINDAAASEKSVPRRGHPQTIHLWWARRPLAAVRGVLFAQLVDDPASWPELFPSESDQIRERERLFDLTARLVKWENSRDEGVLGEARLEIARAHARRHPCDRAARVLATDAAPAEVDAYIAECVPSLVDPFCGGGTIPLEGQRLGLRATGTDLNPVAVLVSKSLIEIGPRFAGRAPVHPGSRRGDYRGLSGLADDVAYYGDIILGRAKERLSQLYPLASAGGQGSAPREIIAWIWARTVESPNPAFRGCQVPLASSFWLTTKAGRETWIEPIVAGRDYHFEIRSGPPTDRSVIGSGTKSARGANFRCVLSGAPIPPSYIKGEGEAGRLGARLMAIVVQTGRRRVYLSPPVGHDVPDVTPPWIPAQELPSNRQYCNPPLYGMRTFGDLFTRRQLAMLCAFSDLVREVRDQVERDASHAGFKTQTAALRDGGDGSLAYSEAIATYLALALGRLADYNSTLCTWNAIGGSIRSTFARQAFPITWDFYETNPLATTTGSWGGAVAWVADVLRDACAGPAGVASQCDVVSKDFGPAIISTDPPYYDNVPYADLSDFFYIWLRRTLHDVWPNEFSTISTPKGDELVANPARHGGRVAGDRFFMERMREALRRCAAAQVPEYPCTIYYAFKQAETDGVGVSSTGWEAFLEAVLQAGLSIDGTWPVRSERAGRMRDVESNALASSIVLSCRKRDVSAVTATRGDFRRELRKELPAALKKLQHGNIAPVDVAQASIGPGMAVFSRHGQVLEADGSHMTVRAALQLINEVLDEYLASGEGDFDADTRFAITWYEQYGWTAGAFGDAETLAKARNISVSGVVDAGICHSGAGKVRILKRPEMRPLEYDPAADERPTIWEFTQHMIRFLEDEGEEAAARLLKKLGSASDATRELAYRLYNTCERKKWAEDARAYNGLILAWPELEKLAAKVGDEPPPAAPSAPGKKDTKAKKTAKGQARLFERDDDE